jgi:hypothetical protein
LKEELNPIRNMPLDPVSNDTITSKLDSTAQTIPRLNSNSVLGAYASNQSLNGDYSRLNKQRSIATQPKLI